MLVCYLFVYCGILTNKTDIMKTPLANAYDKLRELNIDFDEKYILIEVMSKLSAKSYNKGYNDAIETSKKVYEKL